MPMTEDGRERPSISARAMDMVVIIVALVWAVSFTADIWVVGYEPPTGLHQVMMLLIGFIVAGRTQLGKNDNGEKE